MKRTMLAALVLQAGLAAADEKKITVPGSKVEYPAVLQDSVADKPVTFKLTGAALRQKAIFNVYTIASYVAADAVVKTSEQLAAADAPKRLHLVMERDLSGKEIAQSLRSGVEANHGKEFDAELKMLDDYCKTVSIKKGANLLLTHVPGVGVSVLIADKMGLEIGSVKFSNAVWEIYLGKKNIGERLRRALVARL